MKIKVSQSIGKFAVIRADGIAEVLQAEYLSIAMFVVDYFQHVAQLGLVFGGYDSGDLFHICHVVDNKPTNAAHVTIRDNDFLHYFTDKNGSPLCDFNEQLLIHILEERGFALANQNVWGFEDVEITINEKSSFTKRPDNVKLKKD